jgi:hypothetical protein
MEQLLFQIKRIFTNRNKPDILQRNQSTNHDLNSDSGTFVFFGDEYSLSDLRNAKLIKPYHKMRYEEIGLYQDCFGRMFIQTSREQFDTEGKRIRTTKIYCFVKSLREADILYHNDGCLWGVEPYIYESGDGTVSLHQNG